METNEELGQREQQRDDALERMLELADMFAAQVATADSLGTVEAARDNLERLKVAIPSGTLRAATAINKIGDALQLATQRVAELESNEQSATSLALGTAASAGSLAFQSGVRRYMSSQEQSYLDSFTSGKQYELMTIDENGHIVSSGKTIDGAVLKEDFARIKYHTLTKEQQSDVPPPPEGTSMATATPGQKVEELDKLKTSLDHLEGHKAQQLQEQGHDGDEQCRHCHQNFDKARNQATELKMRYRRIKELRETGQGTQMEELAAGFKEQELKKTLQTDIIDGTLTGDQVKQAQGTQITQGTTMEMPQQFNTNLVARDSQKIAELSTVPQR